MSPQKIVCVGCSRGWGMGGEPAKAAKFAEKLGFIRRPDGWLCFKCAGNGPQFKALTGYDIPEKGK